MQPAQSDSDRRSRPIMKWGPIGAIVAVIAIIAVVVVIGDNDEEEVVESDVSTSSSIDTTTTTEADGAPNKITYPLSFDQATELGLDIDWGDRCDTTLGVVAVPDFFAPQCFAPFTETDNGGATAIGVTADTVTVVYYLAQENDPIIRYITDAVAVSDTNAEEYETLLNLVDYYQTFYETYGRKIELVLFEGSGVANDDVAARADAVRIAEDIKPFMVLGGPALTSAFADELTARGVACISCTPSQPSEWYAERDPLAWAIDGSAVQKQAHLVEFIDRQLTGRPAEFAGDPVLADQERRFGLLYIETGASSKVQADSLAQRMEEIGAPIVERIAYALDPATLQQTAAQAIARLKAAGVTTVIFNGDPVAPRDFTREATAQGWFPEWLIGAVALVDTTAFARTYDQDQWRNAFGITTLAARQAPRSSGYYRVYTWFTGEEPPGPDTIGVNTPPLALFFSVLQATGPNLTHQTWRDALVGGSGTQQAISQPYLTWGEKGYWPFFDYHGIDDATIFWWDSEAEGLDEIRRDGRGMYQYVEGGRRFLPGEWPSETRLFDPNGAIAVYGTPPEGEAPRDYPPPLR